VLDAKIGSVIEKPGFSRASPACTAAVEGPAGRAAASWGLEGDRAGSEALVEGMPCPCRAVSGLVIAGSVVASPAFFQ
jgi:hypothetical protein